MATILELARKMQRGEAPPPPIGRLLGFVLKVIEPGRAVFEMGADERHHNPMGTLHGGVYCYLAVLSGGVLGGALLFGRSVEQRRGESKMSDTRFTVDHVRRTTDKPFKEVTTAFERQLGRFEPGVYQALAAGGDAEGARAKIEAMAGPSGFMLFATHNHGALLRLAGQKRKAVQYVVGNPLFALQMTQHDIRAG